MKTNIEYYRHEKDSHNHWKFKKLRRKLGWDAEGRFWALNNMIADADYCKLHIGDTSRKEAVAEDLDYDLTELDQFLHVLEVDCKLISVIDGYITTDITQETLYGVMDQRSKDRDRKKRNGNAAFQQETQKFRPENEESKVKKSKEDQSKAATQPAIVVPLSTPQADDVPSAEVTTDEIYSVHETVMKDTRWQEITCMSLNLKEVGKLHLWLNQYNLTLTNYEGKLTPGKYKAMVTGWLRKKQEKGIDLRLIEPPKEDVTGNSGVDRFKKAQKQSNQIVK